MTELGIIASVVQIADIGLRLSIKLYTFGEIVASADRSVISISKDVSLTSGVLKELGQILDKDKETGLFSETAVERADGVVKECLEVFKEMENIIVKKLPSLGAAGKGGGQGERVKRATVMLERLKWGYLQPKLELLRSNLDSLKSTLLLMLNVITYARQVSEKTELPSVIAEQKCLIKELAHSNQEYVLKFERLKLGIEGPAEGPVDDAPRGGVVEMEPSNITKSLSGTLTRKFKRIKSAIAGTSLQDKENSRGLGPKELNTTTWPSPNAQRSITGPLATPPNADTDNMFINTSVHSSPAISPVQERGLPTTEAEVGFDHEVLFKQLEHHSMLITNLLKDVEEAQYKITFQSRLRMKGGILDLHKGKRRDLEKMWGLTALQSAERRLDSLMEGIGELPRVNNFAAPVASAKASPSYMADNIGTRPFSRGEPVAEAPQYDLTYKEKHAHAMPRPASIYFPTTYAGDTTPRTDMLLDNPSYASALPSSRQFQSEPRWLNTNSDTPTVKSAPSTVAFQKSRTKGIKRGNIAKAKAKAEEQKSSTNSMRKDTGDRIGGYIEPHQEEEDDTGEGGADMLDFTNASLQSSAGKQSEAIGKPGTDSAAPLRSVSPPEGKKTPAELLGIFDYSESMSPRKHPHCGSPLQYSDSSDLHANDENFYDVTHKPYVEAEGELTETEEATKVSSPMSNVVFAPINELDEHRTNFDHVDKGDTEEKRANGEFQVRLGRRAGPPQMSMKSRTMYLPVTERGDSQLADMDLVDRLVSLWTTVKPWDEVVLGTVL